MAEFIVTEKCFFDGRLYEEGEKVFFEGKKIPRYFEKISIDTEPKKKKEDKKESD